MIDKLAVVSRASALMDVEFTFTVSELVPVVFTTFHFFLRVIMSGLK